MDSSENSASPQSKDLIVNGLTSAKPLSALQLNAIKLDARHTLLTPDYLEKIISIRNNSDNPQAATSNEGE